MCVRFMDETIDSGVSFNRFYTEEDYINLILPCKGIYNEDKGLEMVIFDFSYATVDEIIYEFDNEKYIGDGDIKYSYAFSIDFT